MTASMDDSPPLRIQVAVFALVSAAFTNIYITQPVLPVLQREFAADMVSVSFSVSAVILGIALSNLPFGFLADRVDIRPLVLAGGICVALGGLAAAFVQDLWLLIGLRFFQGFFIPTQTTCLAAFLARTLPLPRLNVVMGAYVSVEVVEGVAMQVNYRWTFEDRDGDGVISGDDETIKHIYISASSPL